MSAVTLPLSLLETRSAGSYRAHKKHQAARQKAEPELSRATAMRDRIDGWCTLAARYDNQYEDFAAHKRGLVVLDRLSAPSSNDPHNALSGDISFDLASGQKSRAKLLLKGGGENWRNESELSYRRRGDKETYTETSGEQVTWLVIDHAKGTLTYTEGP